MSRFSLGFLAQRRKGAKFFAITVIVLAVASVSGQSIDPNAPSPVRSNSITGRIAARDLGDARLTDHYYTFTGTPGDLLITVNSTNLNGDIDVFTATTLRPLLKLTVYAENTSPVTKGIYLRKREDLILRIEARSPNDDEGTYRLSFGGSFEPIVGGPEISEAEMPATTETRTPGTKRVLSVGARINEPEPPVTEVATATPTPEPTPEATPEAKPVETPAATPEKSPETERPVSRVFLRSGYLFTGGAPGVPQRGALAFTAGEAGEARVRRRNCAGGRRRRSACPPARARKAAIGAGALPATSSSSTRNTSSMPSSSQGCPMSIAASLLRDHTRAR